MSLCNMQGKIMNQLLGKIKSLFIKFLHYFVYFLLSSVTEWLTDLEVFLLCQQVVEGFVDRLVVVVLDRPQVRLHQLQLVHLIEQKTNHINHVWHRVTECKQIQKVWVWPCRRLPCWRSWPLGCGPTVETGWSAGRSVREVCSPGRRKEIYSTAPHWQPEEK